MVNLFKETCQNPTQIRAKIVEMLQKEEKGGYVQITRNDDFVLSNGVPVDVVEAKIAKGKRGLMFRLHFNGFLLQSKTLSLVGSDYLFIGEQSVDFKHIKVGGGFDNISISVDY